MGDDALYSGLAIIVFLVFLYFVEKDITDDANK
jgi:hypothetical protein